MTEFDKNVWISMVNYLRAYQNGKVEFIFLDDSQVELICRIYTKGYKTFNQQ